MHFRFLSEDYQFMDINYIYLFCTLLGFDNLGYWGSELAEISLSETSDESLAGRTIMML